jgi:hypothetical protein
VKNAPKIREEDLRACVKIASYTDRNPMYSLLGGLLALLIVILFALGMHRPYEP